MSAQIQKEHKDYYDILERTQKGTMDVTPWMEWFLGCLGRALGWSAGNLGRRFHQSSVLGSHQRRAAQRPSAAGDQPSARRVRRQTHNLEIRCARKVLPGHGAS